MRLATTSTSTSSPTSRTTLTHPRALVARRNRSDNSKRLRSLSFPASFAPSPPTPLSLQSHYGMSDTLADTSPHKSSPAQSFPAPAYPYDPSVSLPAAAQAAFPPAPPAAPPAPPRNLPWWHKSVQRLMQRKPAASFPAASFPAAPLSALDPSLRLSPPPPSTTPFMRSP